MRAAMVVCTSVLFLVVTRFARPRDEACSVPRSPLDLSEILPYCIHQLKDGCNLYFAKSMLKRSSTLSCYLGKNFHLPDCFWEIGYNLNFAHDHF
ncbi:hypothetical protein OPV22_032692 [Ensete ventricosum]|uniref:Prolamin-like domain-containing protein n=1 Tax=Ensete ventricosum TaxID=4639 RepID=A0AAV8PN63_ENSVE|nr:hypothetical protein OPV22_032692 [Ensete ventricosum]